MPSSPSNIDDPYYDEVEAEKTLDRLRQRVRFITSRSRTIREHDLAKQAILCETVLAERLQEVDRRDTADMETPPAELVRAMRSPVGVQQLVVTYIHGRKVKAVIEPLGKQRPDRELAVWKCLIGLVEDHAA